MTLGPVAGPYRTLSLPQIGDNLPCQAPANVEPPSEPPSFPRLCMPTHPHSDPPPHPTPSETAQDLRFLAERGFTDAHFCAIHHFDDCGRVTISAHLKYLEDPRGDGKPLERYRLSPPTNAHLALRVTLIRERVEEYGMEEPPFYEYIAEALKRYPMSRAQGPILTAKVLRKAAFLCRHFDVLTEARDWVRLDTLGQAPLPGFRTSRVAKVQDGHLYFTIGETRLGRTCNLNGRLQCILGEEGLPVREVPASHGLPKVFVGFNLDACSEATLERVVRRAYEAIAACTPESPEEG